MKQTLFEDFLLYCEEDNKKLSADIKCWLSDYFDVRNRIIPLTDEEKKWIKENLSKESQIEILGEAIK